MILMLLNLNITILSILDHTLDGFKKKVCVALGQKSLPFSLSFLSLTSSADLSLNK